MKNGTASGNGHVIEAVQAGEDIFLRQLQSYTPNAYQNDRMEKCEDGDRLHEKK